MIDLQDIKQRYPLLTTIEAVTGERPVRNMIRCPFHGDDTPSLAIYADDHWHCFGCGRHGDLFDFLGLLWFGDGYRLPDVIDRLGEYTRPITPAPRRVVDVRPQQTLDQSLPDKWSSRLDWEHFAEWQADGISLDTLAHFRIGTTGERYTFPWFYRGVFTACKMRRIERTHPHLEPKYISLTGSRFGAPYNIDAVISPVQPPPVVIIAEDEKSVMAAHENGLTAVSKPANAWRPEYNDYLSGVERVIIAADWDTVGELHAAKVQSSLRRAEVVLCNVYRPDGTPCKDLYDIHAAGLDVKGLLGL